jgi:hypothetical protein
MAILTYTSMKCSHMSYHPHLTCALRVEVIAEVRKTSMLLSLFRIYGCPVACILMVVCIIFFFFLNIYKNLRSAIIIKFILKDVILIIIIIIIILILILILITTKITTITIAITFLQDAPK